VYLFCHLTCLSSFCVFVLSFDLFIFVLCICSVIWLVYLRSVYLFCNLTSERRKTSRMTEQIHRAKINKSNDRTNTQSEDKQVEWQNKSLCVFVLSFDLFIFVLCICSVIWLVYLRSVHLFCNSTCLSSDQIHRAKINKSNDRTNTQSEDKQVEWQNKYTDDLFIFALCMWSVSRLVYLRSVYLVCHSTCFSSLCVFSR
jgi:anaerobic C4-dicarboxylate transporter